MKQISIVLFLVCSISYSQILEKSYCAKDLNNHRHFSSEIMILIDDKVNKGSILNLDGINHFSYTIQENYIILKKEKDTDYVSDTLKIIDNALIDERNQTIYLKEQMYRTPKMLFVIDGVKYFEKFPNTTNGIITSNPKRNRKLIRKVKKLDLNIYEPRILKGFEAIEKYGADGAFGVVELKKEN